MQLGGTIYDLTSDEVSKPEAAKENAEAFARAVVGAIQTPSEKEGRAA